MNVKSLPIILASVLSVFAITMASPLSVSAQSGMEFDEFARKIDPYFAEDLIADVRSSMPQGSQYRIWGWDVGDFSGDGFYDLAMSVNILGTRKRECVVYLFVDNEGFLVNISKMPLQYIDLPLEIGVVIKEVTAYVTQKRRAEDWTIRGYRFAEGSVILVDEFVSDRIESFGHETFRSYKTLETRERFLTSEGDPAFAAEYLTIPCYSRGRQVFAGFVPEVGIGAVRNVVNGAFWWQGEEDASFRARVVYDDDFLYFRIAVRDSSIITGWCDTCAADKLDIWLDVTPAQEVGGNRYISKVDRNKLVVRSSSDSGLFAFSVRIGDFADRRPSIKVKTTDELDPAQEEAVQLVRVVTAPRVDGYVVKVRVPFVLLGYEKAPIDERSLTELGCTIALYDVDNEFRIDETTVVATSPIQPLNPSTYGAIRFVPEGKWYGETSNIYTDAVLNALRELGF